MAKQMPCQSLSSLFVIWLLVMLKLSMCLGVTSGAQAVCAYSNVPRCASAATHLLHVPGLAICPVLSLLAVRCWLLHGRLLMFRHKVEMQVIADRAAWLYIAMLDVNSTWVHNT